MQRLWQCMYSWIGSPIMWFGVHLAALRNQNLNEGLEGRKGIWRRLEQQVRLRDPNKPLVWFHVASAGEFLQAQPVMERCLRRDYQCALTVTSVNGYKWVQRTQFQEDQRPVVIEYLPFDSQSNMRRILSVLRPARIVYIKYDLWPNLVWEANQAGIPQYLICAVLRPGSKRTTSRLARGFYRSLYRCFAGIFTITDDDRQRFLDTIPEHQNVQTVGDTKYDSVLARKRALPPPKLPNYVDDKFVMIAGSSWPPDEDCIFPALREALDQYSDLLILIVPHEPTEEHLLHSESFFTDVPHERFTQLDPHPQQPPRIILGDTVGILSSLYSIGHLAYVGGAFTAGVHNVTEPAVMGLPVIFGPKYDKSPEAANLLQQGLAFTVSTPQEFRTVFFRFLEHREECRQLGRQAEAAIESHAGVSDQYFALISER